MKIRILTLMNVLLCLKNVFHPIHRVLRPISTPIRVNAQSSMVPWTWKQVTEYLHLDFKKLIKSLSKWYFSSNWEKAGARNSKLVVLLEIGVSVVMIILLHDTAKDIKITIQAY